MAIAFVNSTGRRIPTAASTWSMAVPAVTAGGALIVCVGQQSSTSGASTVTDDVGNVYTKVVKGLNGGAAPASEMWYAANVTSCTRVHATMGASSSGSIGSVHFTGISTGSPLGPSGSSGGNSSSFSASAITPASAGVVVQYARFNGSLGSISTTANFTSWVSTGLSTDANHYGQYWIQGSAEATDGAFTGASGRAYASVIAVFYDTNGGAAPVIALPWSFCTMGVQ